MVNKEAAVAVMLALDAVLQQMVQRPDRVRVVLAECEDVITLDVRVDPADVGRVIGRAGATAKSLRTIVAAMANQSKARYELRLPAGQGREV